MDFDQFVLFSEMLQIWLLYMDPKYKPLDILQLVLVVVTKLALVVVQVQVPTPMCQHFWSADHSLKFAAFSVLVLVLVLWHCWLGVRKSIRPVKIE